MTVRRYYTDSYTAAFTARVLEATHAGERPAALLDETFFYPTSGGQPHDTGTLGGVRVRDVLVREPDGEVLHVLDAPLASGTVEARIDWPRRLDHMQQHTGQHVLSQAFLRVAEAPTIGFHLGAETVSIDLGGPQLSEARIAEAESLANEIVARNAAVRAWFPAEAELAALRLRKTPETDGPLRVVAIGDFDLSACGGTHVAATAEIGLIAVQKTERLKRGVRIEFLCGGRARADYARKHALMTDLAGSLTCAPADVPDSVARLRSTLQETRRELAAYKERELDTEAARLLLVSESEPRAGLPGSALFGVLRVVTAAWADRPVDEVKGIAVRLAREPGVVALLGSAGARAQLVFASSEDVTLDLKSAFNAALARLGGGRGGGARLLQGAAGPADLERVLAALREARAALRGTGGGGGGGGERGAA
jgi:alanyl-tRNA synthetase